MAQKNPHQFLPRPLFLLALACTLLVGGACLAAYVPDATHVRAQVPEQYKWNLDQLFPNDAAWEARLVELTGRVPELNRFKGKLDDPKAMRDCLALYFELHDAANHVTLYSNLKLDTALSDDAAGGMQSRGLALMNDLMANAGFIRGELLALSDKTMEKAYKDKNGPGAYKGYIENLRRRSARVLNPEAERVLSLAGDNLWAEIDLNEIPSSLESTFIALLTDIPWPKIHNADGELVQLNLSNYGRFRASPDRNVRREAVSAFMSTLRQYQHAFAATLGGQYLLDVTYARARNYDTALEAYLDKDGLEPAVYNNLISTVNDNLPALHRYVDLRRRALGLDDIHLYDLYIPFVKGVEVEMPFDEAREALLNGLKPLGDEYVSLLETGLNTDNGWIDLYPHTDKDSGAFSASVYGRTPYVKMNYQDSLDDLSTLAHEFGHALHSHYSMTEQPYSTFRYVPFLAEIASTCNEALLSQYLVNKTTDKMEKANLLVERLEGIRSTIYRQTLFAEFEKVVHGYVEDGRPITSTLLDETYAGLVKRYYGPGYTLDENDGMEWAYIPHFYYKYYVFTYATGLSSGLALSQKILDEGQPAVDAYLTMLKAGCSDAPLELLRGAGVDLTRPEAVEAAMKIFADTVDELEALLEL
jgi:oligoendopeptidase F